MTNELADDLNRTIRDPSLLGTVTITKEGGRDVVRYRGEVVKVVEGVSFDDI